MTSAVGLNPGLSTDQSHPTMSVNAPLPDRAEDAVARLKKSSESELTTRKIHHHHHHHHHHYGDSRNKLSALDRIAPTLHDLEVRVDNSPVLDSVKDFPRHHLGTIVYEYQFHDKVLLPRLEGKENCLLTVRIANRLMTTDNYAVVKRKLWGTDIYTDDSDVVAALYHTGHLRGLEGQLPAPLDAEKQQQLQLLGKAGPASEPKPEERDCVVTLLVLPKLTIYRGSYRHGFNSRTWKTQHDGVSFMIHSVKFVPRGEAENVPLLKKARLDEWNDIRKWTIQTYPEFRRTTKRPELRAVEGDNGEKGEKGEKDKESAGETKESAEPVSEGPKEITGESTETKEQEHSQGPQQQDQTDESAPPAAAS